ncbi:MAG: adenylyl-sulfate kinase [Candidatus Bathyarchaeia archaeon]
MEKGWCIWITGLPGSGKSTIADLLLKKLKSLNIHAQIVSIDMLRQYATPEPIYSEEERAVVYGALVFAAKMLTENGVNTIIDATGNRRRYRDKARKTIICFMEVYLECPLEVCIQRETKRENTHMAPRDIYRKAEEGEAPTVPGVSAPYEEPMNPEVKIDTSKVSAEKCAQKILDATQQSFSLRPKSHNLHMYHKKDIDNG